MAVKILTSRSWNRGYARLMAQNGDWQVEVKPWFRFSERDSSDDNPDITKYMGYYRLTVGYALGKACSVQKANTTGIADMAARSWAGATQLPAMCVSTPRCSAAMANR